jgi:hypothetical protein
VPDLRVNGHRLKVTPLATPGDMVMTTMPIPAECLSGVDPELEDVLIVHPDDAALARWLLGDREGEAP